MSATATCAGCMEDRPVRFYRALPVSHGAICERCTHIAVEAYFDALEEGQGIRDAQQYAADRLTKLALPVAKITAALKAGQDAFNAQGETA